MNLKGRPDSGKIFFIQKMASRLRKPFFRPKKGLPDAGKRFLLAKNGFPTWETIFLLQDARPDAGEAHENPLPGVV